MEDKELIKAIIPLLMDNKLGKEYYLISKSSQNKLYGIFGSIDL